MKLIYPDKFTIPGSEYFIYRNEIGDYKIEILGTTKACRFTGTIKVQYGLTRIWTSRFVDGRLVK